MTMVSIKRIAAIVFVATLAAGVASEVTYAATATSSGARACETGAGVLELLKGNGTCPAGSSPAVLGAQGPAGPAGTTIMSGQVPPRTTMGVTGDYYIDAATHVIYGPAARYCPPYPCATRWGKGTSLVGPPGPANTESGTAYQADGSSEIPSGRQSNLVILPIPVAGYYAVMAYAEVRHNGNDNTDWTCTLVGKESNGEVQNYTGADASLGGGTDGLNGEETAIPLVAGVELGAGERLVVECYEDEAHKGDFGSATILAIQMSSISGAFNP